MLSHDSENWRSYICPCRPSSNRPGPGSGSSTTPAAGPPSASQVLAPAVVPTAPGPALPRPRANSHAASPVAAGTNSTSSLIQVPPKRRTGSVGAAAPPSSPATPPLQARVTQATAALSAMLPIPSLMPTPSSKAVAAGPAASSAAAAPAANPTSSTSAGPASAGPKPANPIAAAASPFAKFFGGAGAGAAVAQELLTALPATQAPAAAGRANGPDGAAAGHGVGFRSMPLPAMNPTPLPMLPMHGATGGAAGGGVANPAGKPPMLARTSSRNLRSTSLLHAPDFCIPQPQTGLQTAASSRRVSRDNLDVVPAPPGPAVSNLTPRLSEHGSGPLPDGSAQGPSQQGYQPQPLPLPQPQHRSPLTRVSMGLAPSLPALPEDQAHAQVGQQQLQQQGQPPKSPLTRVSMGQAAASATAAPAGGSASGAAAPQRTSPTGFMQKVSMLARRSKNPAEALAGDQKAGQA